MGDEQRVSWQELLAQSRDDFEAGTDFTLAVTFRLEDGRSQHNNETLPVAAAGRHWRRVRRCASVERRNSSPYDISGVAPISLVRVGIL